MHRDYLPWDLPEVLELHLIPEDPHAWLKGAVAPVVRSGVGWTKSGHPLASLGDTSIAFDPIAGQGAQGGLIQAALYIERLVEHEGAFDETWIRNAFEAYYTQRGAAAERVKRLFLGHSTTHAIADILVSAANGSERFAGALFGLISHPQPLLGGSTVDEAKALVTQFAGEEAEDVLARSAARIEVATKAHAARELYFARSRRG